MTLMVSSPAAAAAGLAVACDAAAWGSGALAGAMTGVTAVVVVVVVCVVP